MIHYDDYAIQLIEWEICNTYHNDLTGYSESECLLDIRQRLLNNQALTRDSQEELLSHIIAFNDALRDALKRMYDRAHELYHQMSAIQPNINLTATCYLDYPALHPYQGEDRENLFCALCDSGWNPLYDDGVSFPLVLPRDLEESFDSFIGMDCPPPNWNELLDEELTKDLHIIQQFNNLLEHTKFALTDFIFCREFYIEISTCFEEKIK